MIQAEDFNTGGEGVGYYDTTSSNFGGVYRTGDDVDIEAERRGEQPRCLLDPAGRVAQVHGERPRDRRLRRGLPRLEPQAGTQIRMQVDGTTATTFTVPNTGGYDTYTNVTQKVRLTYGAHVLRLTFGGYHNIDYMAFGAVGTLTSRAPSPRSRMRTPRPRPRRSRR